MRTLKAAGVDHVKVDLTLTDEQLRAVIEECRAQGLPVATMVASGRRGVFHVGRAEDVIDSRHSWT